MSKDLSKHQVSRREFVKKAAYVAPAVITLQAAPRYAKAGSQKPRHPRPGDQGDQNQQ